MRVALLLACALAVPLEAGCLKKSVFTCLTDDGCGAGGVCEDNGFCSVADSTCAGSGRRYSDTAGTGFEGQCVGGNAPTDGPVEPDAPVVGDAPVDMPVGTCTANGYAAITDGEPGHTYKVIAVARNWSDSHNLGCVLEGGYLAIPNAAGELAALFAAGGNTARWVGFREPAAENNFTTSLGAAFDPAGAGITIVDNKMNEDCGLMISGTDVDMESCNAARVAICECDN